MARLYPDSEGLQVVANRRGSDLPEVRQSVRQLRSWLRVSHREDAPEVIWPVPKEIGKEESSSTTARVSRRRLVIIILISVIIAVIVAAAVIGGVVGRSKSSSQDDNAAIMGETKTGDNNAVTTPGFISVTKTGSLTSNLGSAAGKSSTLPFTTDSSSAIFTSTKTTITTSSIPMPTEGLLPLNCPAINNTQYTVQSQSFIIYCLMGINSSGQSLRQSRQPSIDDCVDDCATYNTNYKNDPRPCQGLTFSSNLTSHNGSNCYLKTGPLKKSPYKGSDQAGAVLIG